MPFRTSPGFGLLIATLACAPAPREVPSSAPIDEAMEPASSDPAAVGSPALELSEVSVANDGRVLPRALSLNASGTVTLLTSGPAGLSRYTLAPGATQLVDGPTTPFPAGLPLERSIHDGVRDYSWHVFEAERRAMVMDEHASGSGEGAPMGTRSYRVIGVRASEAGAALDVGLSACPAPASTAGSSSASRLGQLGSPDDWCDHQLGALWADEHGLLLAGSVALGSTQRQPWAGRLSVDGTIAWTQSFTLADDLNLPASVRHLAPVRGGAGLLALTLAEAGDQWLVYAAELGVDGVTSKSDLGLRVHGRRPWMATAPREKGGSWLVVRGHARQAHLLALSPAGSVEASHELELDTVVEAGLAWLANEGEGRGLVLVVATQTLAAEPPPVQALRIDDSGVVTARARGQLPSGAFPHALVGDHERAVFALRVNTQEVLLSTLTLP